MAYHEKQKPFKPKIDDVIGDLLDGENLNRALEFIAYLKTNNMSSRWANTNTWKVVSKGITVCYIKAGVERDTGTACYVKFTESGNSSKGAWVIIPHITSFEKSNPPIPRATNFDNSNGYEEIMANDEQFNMILSKVRLCSNCGNKKKCAPGITVTIWGKELTNRCKFVAIPFLDPSHDELECVKTLINIFRDIGQPVS